jgi:hypothetical protein
MILKSAVNYRFMIIFKNAETKLSTKKDIFSNSSAAPDDGILPLDPRLDDISSTPYPRRHADCLHRAIGGTGAALNTAVQIPDISFFISNLKYRMWTDRLAHTTANTGINVKLQGGYIFKISETIHYYNSSTFGVLYNKRRTDPGNYADK